MRLTAARFTEPRHPVRALPRSHKTPVPTLSFNLTRAHSHTVDVRNLPDEYESSRRDEAIESPHMEPSCNALCDADTPAELSFESCLERNEPITPTARPPRLASFNQRTDQKSHKGLHADDDIAEHSMKDRPGKKIRCSSTLRVAYHAPHLPPTCYLFRCLRASIKPTSACFQGAN